MKQHFVTMAGLFFAGAVSFSSCSNKTYEKTESGIIVQTKDSTKVRLEVISSDIIRVTATVDKDFSSKKSLVVLPQKKYSDWDVKEVDSLIILSTPTLSAVVSPAGNVCFKDQNGNMLLNEEEKAFQHVDSFPWLNHANQEQHHQCVAIDSKDSYYRVMERFTSSDDEAFYGLGGHQHGMMNYKGKDVELAQHNMIPCVPFLYSNKNYGILWDNYSITRFGDTREYQQISDLTLYDKNGHEGSLTATYFLDGKNPVKELTVNTIDYAWLATDGTRSNITDSTILEVIKAHDGKIVWEGQFESNEAGIHKFLLYGSSYFKLWIDGKIVFDKWRQNWNPWSNPFEVAMKPGEKHSIRLEWNTNWGFLGLTHLTPNPEQQKLTLSSEAADEIDYYFVRGNNADEVIAGYRTLTGKATIVPKWAMGFWQSRQRYQTEDEILTTVKEFRDRHFPLDNIVLDWHYWPTDSWGSHEFDSIRFAHPKEMVDSLHNTYNAHIMISVWPKFYERTAHYKEMTEKGFMLTHNVDMNRIDWVWPGFKNGFYDVYNPGARELFWKQLSETIYPKGFDAWWLDATEPDMHSNISVADRKVDLTPNYCGNGERMFNPYATLQAKGVYEGQRKTNNDKRVFILTRSAFLGLQHYGAANWSGDIVSRWSDLKDQIGHGTNFSISGIPFWTMDIGGFSVEERYSGKEVSPENLAEWKELQTRWYQFGSFCPLYRSHGEYPYREPFNIAKANEPTYASILYYSKMRYTLMPYIYTLAGMTYHNDYTIMRPLVMDFGSDKKVLNINDQYMFGPSLLINPVTEYKARNRQVYLPAGTEWYDFNTGKCIQGGQTITANAPYERMPIFVKAGAIIPTGIPMEYTNQYPDSVITLYVYDGANGSFNLYSDEATNYNYEQGKFSIIPITYNNKTGVVEIGDRQGEYNGMQTSQTFNIVYVSKNRPVEFASITTFSKTIQYKGKRVSINCK